jgi:RNA polymerase subunit RPABC4/transcription elongation factor Spt4
METTAVEDFCLSNLVCRSPHLAHVWQGMAMVLEPVSTITEKVCGGVPMRRYE